MKVDVKFSFALCLFLKLAVLCWIECAFLASSSAQEIPALFTRPPTRSSFDAPPMSTTYAKVTYAGLNSFRDARFEFRSRMIDDYLAQTKDDESIQDGACQFMKNTLSRWVRRHGSDSWESLNAEGEKIVEAGSRDPLVQMFYGLTCSKLRNSDLAVKLYRESIAGFQDSNYPARCTIYGSMQLAMELDTYSPPEFNAAADYYSLCLAYWINQDRRFDDKDIRVVFAELRELFDRDRSSVMPSRKWHWAEKKVADSIYENEAIAPWLRLMLKGAQYQNQAWNTRKRESSALVAERDWIAYRFDLRIVGQLFEKAWDENNAFPEAAARLVSVSMAGCHVESAETWFQRSVEVEPAWLEAHDNFLYSKRTQWGGKAAEMLEFGRSCLRLARFETAEPLIFIQALQDAQDESPDFSLLKDEGLRAEVEKCFLGVIDAVENQAHSANYYRTMFACFAAQNGAYQIAASQFDLLGNELSQSDFDWGGQAYSLEYLRARSYAFTGERSERAVELDEILLAARDTIRQDVQRFGEIVQEVANSEFDPRERLFWQVMHRIHQMEKAYDSGEWVEMAFDLNMDHWQKNSLSFLVPHSAKLLSISNTQIARREADPLMLTSWATFPGNKEIQFDIKVSEGSYGSIAYGPFVGNYKIDAATGNKTEERIQTVIQSKPLRSYYGMIDLDRPPSASRELTDSPHHARILLGDSYMDFRVNGNRLMYGDRAGNVAPEPLVGLTALAQKAKSSVPAGEAKIANFRVRKWQLGPPPSPRDLEAQLTYWRKVVQVTPKDSYAWEDLGMKLYHTKNYEEAISTFEKSNSFGAKPRSQQYLVLSLQKLGDVKRYVEYFDQLKPEDLVSRPSDVARLGWILATIDDDNIRDAKKAVKLLTAVAKENKTSEIYNSLGVALAETGELQQAMSAAQQAFQLARTQKDREKIVEIFNNYQAGTPVRETPEWAKK